MLGAAPDRLRPIVPATLLRPGLLDGLGLVVAGPDEPVAPRSGRGPSFADAVADGCAGLGASVARLLAEPDEDAVRLAAASLPERAYATVLVCDGAGLLAAHADGESLPRTGHGTLVDGAAAVSAALASVWNAIRAVAVPTLLEAGRPGRIISIAPPCGSPLADAARAALENLARTLSVEWARHATTAVSIAPGAGTAPEEVATLVAFLASPAGGYYSGCQLDLRGPSPRTG